jgi:hypothetical protein
MALSYTRVDNKIGINILLDLYYTIYPASVDLQRTLLYLASYTLYSNIISS